MIINRTDFSLVLFFLLYKQLLFSGFISLIKTFTQIHVRIAIIGNYFFTNMLTYIL